MQNKDSLMADLDTMQGFHDFTQVYQQISVMRMQKIREQVLKNRLFQQKLAGVYYEVKHSYTQEVMTIELRKHSKTPVAIKPEDSKSLSILLTSSGRMYGDIFSRVFNSFRESISSSDADIMLIGKIAKQYFERYQITKPYAYFELPDREVKYEDLKDIIDKLIQYKNVTIYFAKFENIMTQKSEVVSISGDTVEKIKEEANKPQEGQDKEKQRDYIFEPSLENVLHFFDTQVFASAFKQAIHESDLSRFAARIQTMERASMNTEQNITALKNEMKRVIKLIDNNKQIERISGISVWSK